MNGADPIDDFLMVVGDETTGDLENSSLWSSIGSLVWSTDCPSMLAQVTYGLRMMAAKEQEASTPVPLSRLGSSDSVKFEEISHTCKNKAEKMNFKMTEHAAGAFQDLRKNVYLIKPAEFIDEWDLPEEKLTAAEGAGRSGALFCFSKTKRFIFKTIFKNEVDTLNRAIKSIHKYNWDNPNTLIMRMLALVTFDFSSPAYVLVFSNVMWSGIESPLKIQETFDLKGRRTKTRKFHAEEEEDEIEVQKDKHLGRLFYVGNLRRMLIQQLKADVELLRDHRLMDYSLLIGVHQGGEDLEPNARHKACTGSSIFREYQGGLKTDGEILFIGIIDCLTYYGAAKKVASSFKSFIWNKEQLSTVDEKYYSIRFLQYMKDIFPAGPRPAIAPFTPRAATGLAEDITIILSGLQTLLNQNPNPSILLSPEEFGVIKSKILPMPSPRGEAISVDVKEYAPSIFARLREEWGCQSLNLAQDFALPILKIQANIANILNENGEVCGVSIPTNSNQYLLKTVSKKDVESMLSFLPVYTHYIIKNPDSFLAKVVGIYRFVWKKESFIIVTENPEFCTLPGIPFIGNRIYCLQGEKVRQPEPLQSRDKRATRPIMCTDKHLDRNFSLGEQKDSILAILIRDAEFLKGSHVMRYTLNVVVGEMADGADLSVLSRRLVENDFGEWILFSGIHDFWRYAGKHQNILSYLYDHAEPISYHKRFHNMVESIFTT